MGFVLIAFIRQREMRPCFPVNHHIPFSHLTRRRKFFPTRSGSIPLIQNRTRASTRERCHCMKEAAGRFEPVISPVVVDAEASHDYTFHENETPTLTRTRTGQFGHWCGTKGRWLSLAKLDAVQGHSLVRHQGAVALLQSWL